MYTETLLLPPELMEAAKKAALAKKAKAKKPAAPAKKPAARSKARKA
jgi:hypothetical protein